MGASDQAGYTDESKRLRERVARLEKELSDFRRSSRSPEVTLIRRLMEDAPVGFVFLNTDFCYEVVNRKLAEMHGLAASLHIGRTVDEIVPHLAAQVRRAFDQVIATGKPLPDVEFSGETAHEPGVVRHWSESWYPIHAVNGRLLGVGAVITEITGHKRAIEALRVNQQRLELAQAAAGIGAWEWDLTTNEVHCSMEYCPLYGLPPGNLAPPYEEWLRLVHPEDSDRLQSEVREVLAGLDEFSSEFRVVWPDSTIHWLMGKGRVYRDPKGKARRMFGVNMDITERKQAEQAVRDSEQRFRRMADDAPVMICATGPNQRATFFNKGWLSFTGRTMDSELGLGWLRSVHPEDRERTLAEVTESFHAHRYCSVEYRLRRADGEYRWMLCGGAPRFERDGRFIGYVASAMDITEFKRAHEEALSRQKLESVGVLAGGIAHDFNNLLGSIMAESELLESDLGTKLTTLQGIARIKLVTARAAAIVGELLAYSRHETTDFKVVDVSALVAEMMELLRVSISKRAALRVDLPKGLQAVKANPSQIWQVVLNLVTNASEALGDRDGTITVTTTPALITAEMSPERKLDLPEGDYVRLEVSDTGSGMTEEIRVRIFDPFFSTKISGRGLGLAVVQRIVRAHNGAIRVASTPGEGARFEVLLPATAEPLAQTGEGAPDDPGSRAADIVGTVLMVEDEASLRLPVSKMLRKRGYSVLEAENGDAAIEVFRSRAREIGVVVLDLTLPGASGSEVFSQLLDWQPKVKVIVTTAYSQEKAQTDLGGQQSWGFLRKPYQVSDLVSLLQRALVE